MKEIDWEQRRYEIAKKLVVQFCHNDAVFNASPFGEEDKDRINVAIKYADTLIEELKKTSK